MKRFISKYKQTIALVLLMAISAISCRRVNTTTIVTDDGNSSQKIEYSGRIIFSDDQTAIESISKGGRLSFERDGHGVEAETNKEGHVEYWFDDDAKVTSLNANQKKFLSAAIRTIIQQRAKLLTPRK
jgi:hypothetical protein